MVGQLVAWRQLGAAGYFLATNPANTFFYLLTALHGLHVFGGLVALGRTGERCGGGDDVRLSVELCAIYWHFLLVVWLLLFGLLLAEFERVALRFHRPLSAMTTVTEGLRQMAETALGHHATASRVPEGLGGIVADWSSDQRAFKSASWGKAMMWIFLLSDTFIFSCFLLSYMTVRMSTDVPWPDPERRVRAASRRQGSPADPDRHHDLRADQQQRDDGHGGQFRLSARSRQDRHSRCW